ncbi:hypothetical protein H696_00139 [Fonticula alba]|uniref:SYO1-like TPR repeats domain-containing protein n=1 Tax=Fonticula alba TaxID=691883 RepID=A0A058ZF34_FONAL|nr:hypothetical protein H696_00139 [Fonticula alba]KCV72548.1 hypothetical protein H696_00139 [Fonticula alba]|eukprot:XP_009492249.1 hypothetical protein H696_00139 [Fonticula alba]
MVRPTKRKIRKASGKAKTQAPQNAAHADIRKKIHSRQAATAQERRLVALAMSVSSSAGVDLSAVQLDPMLSPLPFLRKLTILRGASPCLFSRLRQLSSTNPIEREWSCICIARFISDAEKRDLLLSNNVVGLVLDRLSDKAFRVQAAATGALRNILLEDDPRIVAALSRLDVVRNSLIPCLLTAVENIANQQSRMSESAPADTPVADTPTEAAAMGAEAAAAAVLAADEADLPSTKAADSRNAVSEALAFLHSTMENALCIFWSLCEVSPTVVEHLTQDNAFLNAVHRVFAASASYSPAVVLAGAQLLLVLSEDNPALAAKVAANQPFGASLLALLDPASEQHAIWRARVTPGIGHLTQAVVCGGVLQILQSAGPSANPPLGPSAGSGAVTTLLQLLAVPVPLEIRPADGRADPTSFGPSRPILAAQKLALEILSSACMVGQVEAPAEGAGRRVPPAGSPHELALLLEGSPLLAALLGLCAPPAEDLVVAIQRTVDWARELEAAPVVSEQSADATEPAAEQEIDARNAAAGVVMSLLFLRQERALQAFGALVESGLSLAVLAPGGVEDRVAGLLQLLRGAASGVAAAGPGDDLRHSNELLEAALVGLSAVLRRLEATGDLAVLVADPPASDLALLCELVASFSGTPQHEALSCLGLNVIGLLARCVRTDKNAVANVAKFLGDVLARLPREESPDRDLVVLAEAINAVIDLFAEPTHDDVFTGLGVLAELQKLAGKVSPKPALLRNLSDMETERFLECYENLVAFVQYKMG